MFQRILVPLDGTTHAEQALPVAARIARASGGSIVLLQVADAPVEYEGLSKFPSPITKENLAVERTRDSGYLATVAEADDLRGIEITTEALAGAVLPALISAVQSKGVDLVVICSHGDTGLKRWMLGSVAQELARHSPVPVLVLRAGGVLSTVRHDSLRALVALDGSPFAEAALVPAAHVIAALAAPGKGALHLTQVVTGPASYRRLRSEIHSDPHIVGRELRDARAYLGSVAVRLRKGELADLGLVVTWSMAVEADVASALIKVAEYGRNTEDFDGCDLIAIATHGRSGLQRLVMGSVAEHILGATKLPLLIVRPQGLVAGREQESGKHIPIHLKLRSVSGDHE